MCNTCACSRHKKDTLFFFISIYLSHTLSVNLIIRKSNPVEVPLGKLSTFIVYCLRWMTRLFLPSKTKDF